MALLRSPRGRRAGGSQGHGAPCNPRGRDPRGASARCPPRLRDSPDARLHAPHALGARAWVVPGASSASSPSPCFDLKRSDAVAKAPACMGYAVEPPRSDGARAARGARGGGRRSGAQATWPSACADVIRERGVEPGPGVAWPGARSAAACGDGRRGSPQQARGTARVAEVVAAPWRSVRVAQLLQNFLACAGSCFPV